MFGLFSNSPLSMPNAVGYNSMNMPDLSGKLNAIQQRLGQFGGGRMQPFGMFQPSQGYQTGMAMGIPQGYTHGPAGGPLPSNAVISQQRLANAPMRAPQPRSLLG